MKKKVTYSVFVHYKTPEGEVRGAHRRQFDNESEARDYVDSWLDQASEKFPVFTEINKITETWLVEPI